MSYRNYAAQTARYARFTVRFTVVLANNKVGIICAANTIDAQREAARWAGFCKSTVVSVEVL